MGCCGRPNNNNNKSSTSNYYERYGYLSGPQRQKQIPLGISSCKVCDAYTSGDPCTVCGSSKSKVKQDTK